MTIPQRALTLLAFAVQMTAANAVELITEVAEGMWSDVTVWRAITYAPTIRTEVDYFPNANNIMVSVEGNVTIDGRYTTNTIMTGFGSKTNYVHSNGASNLLTIDNPSGRTFALRGGMTNVSNNLHIECDVFATKSSGVGTGVAGFVYTDNATDATAPKYLTLHKSFTTTEPITVTGLGAAKSFLTIVGDVESINGGVYGKFNITKATVQLDGNVNVANLIQSPDSALTLNGKLIARGIAGQNLDGVKLQGKTVIGENGGIKVEGNYGNMYLSAGADVVVNSPAGSIEIPRYLRMDGNAKLTFNTSNALIVKSEEPENIAPLWLWGGTQQLILNADNHFRGFCFGTNTQFTVELGDACARLELDSLSVKLDSNDGYLTNANSIRFKNFRNDVVKVNSIRDATELKRVFADGYVDGSFYISSAGYLNAFKQPQLVISGFSNTTNVPWVNSSTTTRNPDGSVSINSAGKSGWVQGLNTSTLKANTQYTITLKYRLSSQYSGYAQIYVRNKNVNNNYTDYASYTMKECDEDVSVTLTFKTDSQGNYYRICIDTLNEAAIEISDFNLYEEPLFQFIPATATEKYTGVIPNIPTGATEFDVNLPQSDTPEITPQMCVEMFGLNENVTNAATIINNMINYCKNSGFKKITLPTGTYRDNNVTRINFQYLTDFTFDGNGSTIVFNKNLKTGGTGNFYMNANTRFKFCNLNIDWDWEQNPLASIVEVVAVNTSGSKYVDFKFTEYDYFPMRNVRVATLSCYDPETQSVGIEGGYTRSLEMYVGQNIPATQWLSDNVLRVFTSDVAPYRVGHLLRMQHSYYEMGNVNMQSNKHITLENVNVYSCSGHAFVCGGTQEYMHFKNVNIVRPPNPYRRAITCTADHLHVSSSKGNLKLENCEFSLGADDCINFHDCTAFMTRLSDTSLRTINNRNTGLYSVGSTLEFRNGDYSPTGFTATVKSLTLLDSENGIYEVFFDKTIPQVYQDGFVLFNKAYDTRNIIVRNCYFHDNRARGVLILARDVTLENCRFFHNEMGAIKFETGYTMDSWCEGYGVDNVVIRNCTFDTVNPGDSMSKDGFARDTYFGVYLRQDPSTQQTYYPILKNILFEGNTFYNTYGLAAWIASTGNLIIRDNTFVNERSRKNPLNYRGAFRVSYSSDTKIVNNTYIASENPVYAGVYYSTCSTSGLVVAGNTTVPKTDISIATQPESLNLNLKPDESVDGQLSVSANSWYGKKYQWYMSFDSGENAVFTPVSGAISAALDISKLNLQQTAYFYCVASDSSSSAKSDVVSVAVTRYINQLGATAKAAFSGDALVWQFAADYAVKTWIFTGEKIDAMTFDSAGGTLSGTLSRGGEYAFEIEAVTEEGATSGNVGYTLSVSDDTRAHSSWLEGNFTQDELADTNVSGDLATPAADGVTNLQKYAMGFAPKTVVPPANASIIPAQDAEYDVAFEYLKSQTAAADNVVIALQVSENLVDWIDADAVYKTVGSVGGQDRIRVCVKSGTNSARKFYRLKITRGSK